MMCQCVCGFVCLGICQVDCENSVDQFRLPFGMVRWMVPGIMQVTGFDGLLTVRGIISEGKYGALH